MADWNETTILSNFRSLRAGQFDPLRKEFGIALSDEQLTGCALHCALVLRRDPAIWELLLWDRLAKSSFPAAKSSLSTLETESAAIAETYADMMAKHRDLSPEPAPLTLSGALSLATDALERGGKERGCSTYDFRLTDRFFAPRPENGISEEKTAAFLSVCNKKESFSPVEADRLCLLLDRGGLLHYAFWEALRPLLESDELRAKLHGLFPVTQGGLLPAMLSRFDGFIMDLSRIAQPSDSLPELLAGKFDEDLILTVSESAAGEILANLRALGVRCAAFAKLTGGEQVVLETGRQKWIESADFLRTLAAKSPDGPVVLQADAANTAPVSFQTRFGNPCPFLPEQEDCAKDGTVLGLSASAASVAVAEGAFSAAILASLAPILSCALSGAEYSKMRLAVDLTLPKGEGSTPADAFAAAIGLYRVQAELGIPTVQTRIVEQEAAAPVLSVFALGKGIETPPEKLTGIDSKLYLIPIVLSPEGLPDFSDLRLLLDDLAAQAKHGVIRSARVVLQRSPKEVLANMKSNALIARPKRAAKSLKEPLPLGILIESVYEMPFDCVATVVERKRSQKPAVAPVEPVEIPDQFQIPTGKDLIWRSAPEVVILAPEKNTDALAVARYLRGRGASVTIFTPGEKDQFLRAVLTASVVYRFPQIRLSRDRKTKFALSVLRENGGEIRCLKKIARKK